MLISLSWVILILTYRCLCHWPSPLPSSSIHCHGLEAVIACIGHMIKYWIIFSNIAFSFFKLSFLLINSSNIFLVLFLFFNNKLCSKSVQDSVHFVYMLFRKIWVWRKLFYAMDRAWQLYRKVSVFEIIWSLKFFQGFQK